VVKHAVLPARQGSHTLQTFLYLAHVLLHLGQRKKLTYNLIFSLDLFNLQIAGAQERERACTRGTTIALVIALLQTTFLPQQEILEKMLAPILAKKLPKTTLHCAAQAAGGLHCEVQAAQVLF
jgi:hypothetical protein